MKTYFLFLTVFIFFCAKVGAQPASTVKDCLSIEIQPEFPGGELKFREFIEKKLIYPELASLIGKTGRVVVSFIVEKDGTIGHVKPLSCIGAGCEAEAVRIVEASPRWNPGTQNGKLVRVQYSVPINFNINRISTPLLEFKLSHLGFVFSKGGKEYLLDDIEKKIGSNLQLASIESVSLYPNPKKYRMRRKSEVYLITLK